MTVLFKKSFWKMLQHLLFYRKEQGRGAGKFWPLGGCEKRRKRKRKKRKKRKKKEDFSWVIVDQSNAFLSVISWTYSTIFESIENNYSPLQLETSITLYWMVHFTTITLAILATSWAVISPCLSSKCHHYRADPLDIE